MSLILFNQKWPAYHVITYLTVPKFHLYVPPLSKEVVLNRSETRKAKDYYQFQGVLGDDMASQEPAFCQLLRIILPM